jgi:hypothetical protein
LNVYIRKEDGSKLNTLSFYFGKVEKEEKIKFKINNERNSKIEHISMKLEKKK